jgi:hypothetical protein
LVTKPCHQITGFADNPPGVMLRYKLVQNGGREK